MKEMDSILRLHTELDLMGNAERQLRFAQPELARLLEQTREMEILVPKHALAIEKFSIDLTLSPLVKELNLASRAIASFQMCPEFRAYQANATRISEMTASIGLEFAQTLAPLRTAVAEIGVHFASQLDSHRLALDVLRLADQKWLHDFESVTAEIAEMARVNFTIPETAVLYWPSNLLGSRAPLLEDCVLNTAALETFHAAAILPHATVSPDRLAVASQFVFDHAEVVRRLPPRLPTPEGGERTADGKPHRDEEIGRKLELALRDFDERLLELRRQAWRNLGGGGIAGARLAMAGIRELFTDILHALAPDAEVKTTVMWQARPKNITQPTRRMQLDYVLGEERAGEADALLQFSESITVRRSSCTRLRMMLNLFASRWPTWRSGSTSCYSTTRHARARTSTAPAKTLGTETFPPNLQDSQGVYSLGR
jgi:Predicted pPIWI-associating nuclease